MGSCWKRVLALGLVFSGATLALGQDGPSDLPDAPGSFSSSQQSAQDAQQKVAQGTNSDYDGKQTKRILGIIPNFRSVSADVKLPPMSAKEKFSEATKDSFDYSSIFLPAAVAGYDDARTLRAPVWPWRHSLRPLSLAYNGRSDDRKLLCGVHRAGHYTPGPSLLHQGSRRFLKRAGYSLSRVVITRSDDDREVFNSSEVFGALGAAGISNLYYPSGTADRRQHVGRRSAQALALTR